MSESVYMVVGAFADTISLLNLHPLPIFQNNTVYYPFKEKEGKKRGRFYSSSFLRPSP